MKALFILLRSRVMALVTMAIIIFACGLRCMREVSSSDIAAEPSTHVPARDLKPGVVASSVSSTLTRTATTMAAPPAMKKAHAPPRFAFEALIAGREPVKTETRMFQAQTWEVDLAKALDLPPGTPLQRRSALYRIPELTASLVRVDRVYRMDRGGVVPSAAPAPAASVQSSSTAEFTAAATAAPTPTGSAVLDAGGGELLWDNAMIADHLMVQVEEGVTRSRLQSSLPQGVVVRDALTTRGLYLVAVPADGDKAVERAVLSLSRLKGVVKFAEPDFLICGADTTPDDPLFTTDVGDTTKQWHLPKIMAPRAWDVIKQPKNATIANQSVVAVVDTGVDYTHPDLAGNIWTNPGESGGGKESNGIDDDGNGKIDDWRGWNFVELSNEVMDDVGHGTHVAGVVGAVGNNTEGASGVCWGVKILPLRIIKALNGGTYGTYSAAIAALDYIRTLNTSGRKVAVANHSWGGSGYSLAMLNTINNPLSTADPLPAGLTATYTTNLNTLTASGSGTEIAKIKAGMTIGGTGIPSGTLVTIVNGSEITLSDYTTVAGSNAALTFSNPIRPKPYGVVHVAAAGNSRFNADRIPIYPACLPSGFIVSVGATDSSDAEALWSGGAGTNYGRLNVDLFAPGSSIWSTKWKAPGDPTYGYESRNGTSMAAPQAAGALALVRMWQPNLTELQARQVLIEQVDQVTALQSKCVSGGRLNMAKIIDRLYQPVLVSSGGGTGGSGTTFDALQAAMGVTGRFAMSSTHVLFLDKGEVWAWGQNDSGQLGDGTTDSSAVPVKVHGLTEVTMVTVSSADYNSTSFALKADGTVWVWGSNSYGLHGIGSTSGGRPLIPELITGLSDIAWISAGVEHCLAVRSDGAVFAWGRNTQGQLGDGTLTNRSSPVSVLGVTGVTQTAAGVAHSLALRADGSVFAWGTRWHSSRNQLGDGAIGGTATSAVMVPTLSDVVYVDAANFCSLYLKLDGSVWMAGELSSGGQRSSMPEQVSSLSDIRVMTAGSSHAAALNSDGMLFTWGDGSDGQLGVGSLLPSHEPLASSLPGPAGVIACAAGNNATLILDNEGRLWSCGRNLYGQLGTGKYPLKTIPVKIETVSNAVAIGGSLDDFAVNWVKLSDDTFLMSGQYNTDPVYGSRLKFQRPTAYPPVPGVVQEVEHGSGYWGARCTDGSIWTWGNALYIGRTYTSADRYQPTKVNGLPSITSLSCGPGHSLAATVSGQLYAWGDNNFGELGDGTTNRESLPVLISGMSAVAEVSAGTGWSIARKTDGSVWTWGRNDQGQLGDGTTSHSQTPHQAIGITSAIQVRAMPNDSCALMADGGLHAWGGNVGKGSLVPALIYRPPAERIVKFVNNGNSILALLSDGSVLSWGFGGDGLGRQPGSPALADQPSPVYGGTNVIDIAASRGAFMFLKNDGSVYAWGNANVLNIGCNGLGDSWATTFVPVVGFGSVSTTLSTLGTGDIADSWYFQNFSVAEILDDSLISDTATPAGDGIPNLLKYALGLNPRQRHDASSLPSARADIIGNSAQSTGARGGIGLFSAPTVDLTNGKRYMAFTVPRSGIHTDIDYIVEVSTDLVTWHSGGPHTVTVLDTAETLEVYSAMSLDDVPRQFMRLKIQRK
ncbi:MAG TPA: hypothetical protein DDZ88_15810 [Verrucomicrobiales bacterium]|nr:hypothetical protein [Verrucomicrobiales bacterium]